MPRHEHDPTEADREIVKLHAMVGTPQELIAKVIGIDAKTLRKHYRDELDLSTAQANASVGGKLYSKAMAGDTTAMIFWLKTRAGFRERTDIDLTSGGEKLPAPSVDWSKMSLEALEEIRNAISSDDDQ